MATHVKSLGSLSREMDLESAVGQIDELKARNRKIETKLQTAVSGNANTMPTKQKVTKYVVIGDSVLRNVGAEHTDITVECLSGFKTGQLHGVIEKRDLGSPETAIIHAGTNDFRSMRNLIS
jgi:hypothetical protein